MGLEDWWIFSAEPVVLTFLKVLGVMGLLAFVGILGVLSFFWGAIPFVIYMVLVVAAWITAMVHTT